VEISNDPAVSALGVTAECDGRAQPHGRRW
jgi:hypothetical protein